MKRIMNVIVVLFFVFGASSSANAIVANTENKAEVKQVDVYYFHGDRRCVTCKAVGAVAKSLVENRYGENAKVNFIEINIDEAGNEEIVEKFKVSGSGLLVYNGEKPLDITAYAFQYAIVNPDKLKNKLIQLIDRNLN